MVLGYFHISRDRFTGSDRINAIRPILLNRSYQGLEVSKKLFVYGFRLIVFYQFLIYLRALVSVNRFKFQAHHLTFRYWLADRFTVLTEK